MKQHGNASTDYREEERLTCVLVLDSFNTYTNEIASHTTLPLCLWPVDGKPLLDYTIQALLRSGIQEIILLATSHSFEIRSYVMSSQWTRNYPKLIKFISCAKARSLGDSMKDLEQENIINSPFLLIYGNGTLLTNEKLNHLFNVHKENVKKDKNCIMTLAHRQLDANHLEHPSYTDDQHVCIIRDADTHRVYEYSKEYLDAYEIPLELLGKANMNIETLYCPLDCHLAVCSPSVLHLFKDNFDFLTIHEFVKGVLRDEEIAGDTIYSHLYETGYFLSAHNLRLYMKGTLDVLRRWTYPLVPDILASARQGSLHTATTPASPQIASSECFLTLYNTPYPIVYDKHNIYKQGDIQLDRLSDIQQDVFIGHKSQILSGVCLRSTVIGQNCLIGKNTRIENSIIWNNVQIGENCTIRNSIICDNVQIRNQVQIEKECVLCKGVIIGHTVHLKERTIVIASNASTSSQMMDEVEIDDDLQATPDNFKRSNSYQRRSSTRLSEKSFSDRSISSNVDEAIVSDGNLVGTDGFGKELIFSSTHDEQTKNPDHTDDDDDGDDDDEDSEQKKKQSNLYDAWGSLINPRPTAQDVSFGDEDSEQLQRKRPAADRLLTQKSQVSSDEETSDSDSDDEDIDAVSDEESADDGATNGASEFQLEVLQTLKRAYTKKVSIQNVIDELKMLKPTFAVSPTEFDQSITRAVFLLPFELRQIEGATYWNVLKSTLEQTTQFILKHYLKITDQQAQTTLLNELHQICLRQIQLIGERIFNILNYLYDNDVIDEEWVLAWHQELRANEASRKPEEASYYEKIQKFVQWLKDAESEDDE